MVCESRPEKVELCGLAPEGVCGPRHCALQVPHLSREEFRSRETISNLGDPGHQGSPGHVAILGALRSLWTRSPASAPSPGHPRPLLPCLPRPLSDLIRPPPLPGVLESGSPAPSNCLGPLVLRAGSPAQPAATVASSSRSPSGPQFRHSFPLLCPFLSPPELSVRLPSLCARVCFFLSLSTCLHLSLLPSLVSLSLCPSLSVAP